MIAIAVTDGRGGRGIGRDFDRLRGRTFSNLNGELLRGKASKRIGYLQADWRHADLFPRGGPPHKSIRTDDHSGGRFQKIEGEGISIGIGSDDGIGVYLPDGA